MSIRARDKAQQNALHISREQHRSLVGLAPLDAQFVARECGARVAPQGNGISLYDYEEHGKPQIFDPVHNPTGTVERFSDASARMMDGLRRDAKARDADAHRGRSAE